MTRVAGTAVVLAAAQAAGHPGGLSSRLARACLRRARIDTPWWRLAGNLVGRMLLRLVEWWVLPGVTAHYAWRKRRILAWSQAAVAAGASQVLILGAGFDALGVLLPRQRSGLRVVELDREPVVVAKWGALRDAGMEHGSHRFVACDLGRGFDVAGLGQVPGFDARARTLVVAEGVLMYLPPARVRVLARQLRRLCRGQVDLVATSMSVRAGGAPGFRSQSRWVDRWLAHGNEGFRWGVAPGELAAALSGLGVQGLEIADQHAVADPDPCPGELVWRCRLPAVSPVACGTGARPRSS